MYRQVVTVTLLQENCFTGALMCPYRGAPDHQTRVTFPVRQCVRLRSSTLPSASPNGVAMLVLPHHAPRSRRAHYLHHEWGQAHAPRQ